MSQQAVIRHAARFPDTTAKHMTIRIAALRRVCKALRVPSSVCFCSAAFQPSSENLSSSEDWQRPLGGNPPVICLGKFDAMHRGHRALAAAAAALGGTPWLVSFAGMAEVLGWPARLPLVAPCDRRRVLQTWAPACGGIAPAECALPFAEVRSLSPEAFVELLARDLQVSGVVVGSNYRFGYRAAGTAALLQELGPAYGIKIGIVDLVDGSNEPGGGGSCEQETAVSSSRIRDALAAGDLAGAADCLGRPYRLVAQLPQEPQLDVATPSGTAQRLPEPVFKNQPPGAGAYKLLAQVVAAGAEMPAVGGGLRAEVRLDKRGAVELLCDGELLLNRPGGKLLLDFV